MAGKRRVKIVLDTNWYISASINRRSRRTLFEILVNPRVEILYSKELIQEYLDVIGRPKFRKIISETQALRFLGLVLPRLKEVAISTTLELSRDAKDNFLLAMALDGDIDFLVTGDDDLIVLKQIEDTKIIRMSEFQAVLKQEG